MKTTTTKAAGALLLLSLLAGCGEKFLDVSPNSSVTDENFYQTETDAIQATNAAYAELSRGGQYNYALWGIGDIMSDNSTTGGGGGGDGLEEQQLDNFNIPASNPMTTRLWNGSYVGIGRANLVLEKVPGITSMSDKIRRRCLGEAHFLRAKYYFDLVRAFGDVPLITTPAKSPEDARLPRTPADQVYGVIISDLTSAIGELDESYSGADLGRATKWAAAGLLAKVQLTRGNMGEAARLARDVIGSGKYSLWTNYGDNFRVENENGRESLFEVQYINGKNEYTFDGLGFVGNEFFAPRGQNLVPQNGYGFNVPEPEFVQGYEEGDKRRDVTIWKPGDKYPDGRVQPASLQGSPNGYNVKKWFVGKTNTLVWDSPLNIPVLRLAEIYLIHAEAAGPVEGRESINLVRRRAFGDANHDLPAGMAPEAFKAAVVKERRYELAFECDRWFDLKRTGDLLRSPALQAKGVKPFNVLLPIPQSERDANPNLSQNPGY
ncbi:RagB/SusD family nutrient uptake outer membrane protein [Hymenobacter aquaticus]|uniref:RagB/SusD family nutrient uptake outer membrane protein n=1 Tax=Hymenobacter aquaticus TaxID=1867101 RepID=A0A4Z0PVN2_9BACT|nr:RagB/SusD family nutrient uptake outer membrane protein [Hymenobacter aquaticus]TGE21326.1 RagB/SusD family nutrient uptake outer membrane protein [Hymenobacter aquaticus]